MILKGDECARSKCRFDWFYLLVNMHDPFNPIRIDGTRHILLFGP